MLRYAAVAGGLLLAACASSSDWSEGSSQTGTVIVAIAADRTAGSFRAFEVDLRRADRTFATGLPYTFRGMDADRPDFQTDSETGILIKKRLPPGEYEIADVIGDRGSFWWSKETRPLKPTRLGFTVTPGGTLYLGHFRVGLSQSSSEPSLAVEISDENDADIARARSKYPDLGPVTNAATAAASDARAVAHSGALATP
jgi:hypothetical protein